MKIDELKEGDKIEVNGKEYEVLKKQIEAEVVNPGAENHLKTFTAYLLHLYKSKSLIPNYELKKYETGELIFVNHDNTKIKIDERDIHLN